MLIIEIFFIKKIFLAKGVSLENHALFELFQFYKFLRLGFIWPALVFGSV